MVDLQSTCKSEIKNIVIADVNLVVFILLLLRAPKRLDKTKVTPTK
jgi:hypothetical protein